MAKKNYDEEDLSVYSDAARDLASIADITERDAKDAASMAYNVAASKKAHAGVPQQSWSSVTYTDKYGDQIDNLVNQYINREPFSYDPSTDPIYHYYLDQYTRGGKQAMNDMYGQLAARTGGLGSTAAVTASQNAYNKYMEAAADKIPDLYKLAYDMYRQNGQDQLAAINALQGISDTAYSRFSNDRGFDYGAFRDQRNYDYDTYKDLRDFDAQLQADALANKRYEQEWDRDLEQQEYDRQRQAQADAKARVDGYLASGGSSSALDPELVAASGYSAAELAAYEKYYKDLLAQKKKSGGSSGGSRRSSGGSGIPGDDKWSAVEEWVELYGADTAEDYINEHYKELGYSSAAQARAGWNNHKTAAGLDNNKDEVPEDADPYVTNRHSESWVEVGDSRYSYQEVLDMVERGLVEEIYDAGKNTLTYKMNR